MSEISKKDEVIRVRVAREQKREIFEAARKNGATLSDFLRQAAEASARRVAA